MEESQGIIGEIEKLPLNHRMPSVSLLGDSQLDIRHRNGHSQASALAIHDQAPSRGLNGELPISSTTGHMSGLCMCKMENSRL